MPLQDKLRQINRRLLRNLITQKLALKMALKQAFKYTLTVYKVEMTGLERTPSSVIKTALRSGYVKFTL
ncbi:hypothetical protein F3628_10260 [Vibrio cholerae]|nr:hypothetical protein [Vibrio cholerae]